MSAASTPSSASHGYYRHPTIHGDQVVFVCEDDLWSVSIEGGHARRLTHARAEISRPRFSPDGRWIALTARESGPTECYVMPRDGGELVRRTWFGAVLQTVAWNGDRIVCASNSGQAFSRDYRLFEVPRDSGPAKPLPWGPATAYARSGKSVVLGVNTGDPARWKRYRGGTAGRLWIDRDGDGDFEPLIDLPGNLSSPFWIGRRIWFLSDHEGHGNLYSCNARGGDLRRHSDHDNYYARWPDSDGQRVVYHAGADLWLHDPASGESRIIDVQLGSPRTTLARKFVGAARWIQGAALDGPGKDIALGVRGACYTMGAFEGVVRRHGKLSAERVRLADFCADGKHIVAVSDDGGEEHLVVFTRDGRGRAKRIRQPIGRVLSLAAAPKGQLVALTNQRNELWIANLADNTLRKQLESASGRLQGLAWSPCGRWLAFSNPLSRQSAQIRMLDTQRGKVHEITRAEFVDHSPSFDPDGRFLYFLSQRVYDPVYDGAYFDLGFPRGTQPCLIPLAKDTRSPFDPATIKAAPAPNQPAGATAKPGEAGKSSTKKGSKKTARVNAASASDGASETTRIDLDGIADRVLAFPVAEARYVALSAARGRVFLASFPVEGSLSAPWPPPAEPPAKLRLDYWDFGEEKLENFLPGISGYAMSGDAKQLLIKIGPRLRIVAASAKGKALPARQDPGRPSGWVDLRRLRVEVDPRAEWRQMFDEAWRLQRDHFWHESMAEVDWEAVHARYLPLVDRVTTRSEFSDLLWELQGELGTSHAYELGGEYDPSPQWHLGHLGADFAWNPRSKVWKIRSIPRGDSWNPRASSPLAAPGVDVHIGDEVLEINGERLGPDAPPSSTLVHQAGRVVELELRRNKRRHRVALQALRSEAELRYRNWVENNRDFVHRKSRGRIGYVHIPDMGPRGFSEFHRYYKQEFDRLGLVVDVRWNGGGHVSPLLLQKLLRKRIGYDRARWEGIESYPPYAPHGPMCALTNEHAGSDGDMFSHSFKLLGLGPLIGKRTWGGVIGIWPRHALVDGTVTTQPEFSYWFEDVGWDIENYGTDPDIEVENRPQDWKAGVDRQLIVAIDEVEAEIKKQKPGLPKMPPPPSRKAPRLGRASRSSPSKRKAARRPRNKK